MASDISPPPVRGDGLQLDENRRFQERFWTLQRVGWLGFALLMLAALLGLTGSGGYFHIQRIAFPAAQADLPRIARWEAVDEIAITFPQGGEERGVFLGQGFFDRFTVERIEPAPAESAMVAGGQLFRFDAAGDGPHRIRLTVRAVHFGRARFDLALGGESRAVSLFVLP